MVNANYVVEAGGERYVLKWYRPGLRESAPERLAVVCAMQEAARSRGVEIPALRLTRSGAPFAQTDAGCFVLSEFVDGVQFERGSMPPAFAHSMGAFLHRLHLALAGIPGASPVEVMAVDAALARFEALLRLAAAQGPPRDDVDRLSRTLLREKLTRLEGRTAPVPVLQPQWIHGDFQDTNVIFSPPGEVVAVVDWDAVRSVSAAYEVMRCFAFSFPEGAPEALEFLRGYVGAARPSEAEAGAFVDLWDYVSLIRAWPIDVRIEQPEVYQSRWDMFIQPDSGWWQANKERVRAQLVEFAGAAG